jgi:hypothetical protein
MVEIRQTNFKFPAHWQLLKSRGADHFTTQIIHRLPNGNLHIWSSRQFRKRHSTEIRSSDKISQPELQKRPRKYWGWQPSSLAWWIGFIFTSGSILFVVGAIPDLFPNPPLEKIAVIDFLGSICFTVGSYLAFLEVINLNLDVTLSNEAEGVPGKTGKVRHFSSSLRKIKWFDWQPDRIEYQSTCIQAIGACLFNINCFFAMISGLKWQTIDLMVWFPSTIASICFCWASYLAVMEVCHRYWAWKIHDIDWWIVVLNLVGSAGFLSGSIFGFWGQGPMQCCQYWGTNGSFLLGSLFFLGGSYLLVPEMLDQWRV